MKKLPLLLLFLAVVSCMHRGKTASSSGDSEITDSLSDISSKITAIPLETNPQCLLSELKQVKQSDSFIFIWSGNDIYRFNHQGVFINRITQNNHFPVHHFTINPDNQQVIVLDTLNLIHSYSFDGNILYTEDAETGLPGQAILDLLYHNHSLWAVTEKLSDDNRFEKWLYELDLSFRPLEGMKYTSVDLGHFFVESSFDSKLYVADRKICVYSSFLSKKTLLADTLFIITSGQLNPNRLFPLREFGNVCAAYSLPFFLNKRYLIASYQTHQTESENYLFCFDRKTNKAFNLSGFTDDLYQTGVVKDLQPLDPNNQEYYFYKSGKEVIASFPEREENANPVLFVVKLNG
jgi:hypothetical protein